MKEEDGLFWRSDSIPAEIIGLLLSVCYTGKLNPQDGVLMPYEHDIWTFNVVYQRSDVLRNPLANRFVQLVYVYIL